MNKKQLKEIIKECIKEIYDSSESELPKKSLCELNTISLQDFIDKSEINEESDFLGATTSPLSDKEMQGYLSRVKSGTKTPAEKYKMPFVHGSNIEIKDENDRSFDLVKLKLSIKTRPTKLLKQNEKITHSGGDSTVYFNIGLPALKGLAVNEKTDEFVIVDTCPGAGACKIYCYARKGGYVQWKATSMSQTRVLNYLLNNPQGFKSQLSSEIKNEYDKYKNKNTKVVIRWHDAGDFFSPDYLELAYNVAREHSNVDFYAYTKMASVATGNKPDNFKINFSGGATPEQEKRIDFTKTKYSTVVPKDLFSDLVTKDENDKILKDDKGRMQFSSDNLKKLKDRLAVKYKVSDTSIITYDEMMKLSPSQEMKYNVIVRPGDGDDSANRSDVLGTYLLIH